MKMKDLWVVATIMIALILFNSCNGWEKEMGADLLPPDDNVFLLHDTIFDIHAYPVTGKPAVTSELTYQNGTLYLLGELFDSIVGSSQASIITQFNTNRYFRNGPNTTIDSIQLVLYVDDFMGESDQKITYSVYELTERIFIDSIYYSDFDLTGRYNPDLLGEISSRPAQSDTVEIMLDNENFRQKFIAVETDTAFYKSDSIFKNYFNGLYITARAELPKGAMVDVGLSNVVTRLRVRYANDSTDVDTIAGPDFEWISFSIDEYVTQKINLFRHEVDPGSYLYTIIDRDDISPPYCFVQGIAGVNTKLSFTNLENWIEELGEGKVAINSATLAFDVVPEEIYGLPIEELPERLTLFTERKDGSLERLYDYYAVYQSDTKQFGGILEPWSEGMFHDTTYTYRFNVGLQFQDMVDKKKTDVNFRLQLYDAIKNPGFSVLWGNPDADHSRIRLEIVYLKL